MIHPEGHAQAPESTLAAREPGKAPEATPTATDATEATLRAENEALRLELGDWINDQADKVARLADAEAEIARLDAHYREWQATLQGEYRKAVDALRTLRERVADAWDEGYRSGHSNAMRRMSDEPNAPTSPNPYRAALADAPAEGTPAAEQRCEDEDGWEQELDADLRPVGPPHPPAEVDHA